MPAYPAIALHIDPIKKLTDVINAIPSGVKKSFNFELGGISLNAYITNNNPDVINAYLNIVPYYVTKKPSDPSLITSAISYMLLGPISIRNISHNIFILMPINTTLIVKAENEIILDVDCDTKK